MKPLSHLRVVELGTLPAGAYAARLFADFGAEVIKVEPSGGDPTRTFPPIIAPDDQRLVRLSQLRQEERHRRGGRPRRPAGGRRRPDRFDGAHTARGTTTPGRTW